jgi:hypothetical protein
MIGYRNVITSLINWISVSSTYSNMNDDPLNSGDTAISMYVVFRGFKFTNVDRNVSLLDLKCPISTLAADCTFYSFSMKSSITLST